MNNPLEMHPHARALAATAICAGKQGAYWKMHDVLFDDKPTTRPAMLNAARQLSLDVDSFEKCLDNDSEKAIAKDKEVAQRLGLTGTPAFAIGRAEANGRVRVSKILTGALPFNTFETAINDTGKVRATNTPFGPS